MQAVAVFQLGQYEVQAARSAPSRPVARPAKPVARPALSSSAHAPQWLALPLLWVVSVESGCTRSTPCARASP